MKSCRSSLVVLRPSLCAQPDLLICIRRLAAWSAQPITMGAGPLLSFAAFARLSRASICRIVLSPVVDFMEAITCTSRHDTSKAAQAAFCGSLAAISPGASQWEVSR
ncbi:hypothetical protein EJ03DRAFT_106316 [Teratosphaeria nubilosa]|uniref:Uncharacterized protein n=1 Tax=Teratosphaeria nubilosa TaxID=161662 RepID=A0A6G1L8B2_9PEZI|nr:hypothetical protein EJ03DRAFT_106316 [Teratosphaeria nubilosa]